MQSIKEKSKLIRQHFRNLKESGIPLGTRLFLLLMVLLLTIFLGVIAILLFTGAFTAGLSESEKLVENELIHTSKRISQDFGQLSLQTVEFSKELSKSMEEKAKEMSVSLSNLQEHPQILEKIISNEYERSLFSLQKSKSSGVFFILNATINPSINNAKTSRAGLYLKNMEPNIINSSTPNIIVLRGFPSISRNNSLSLHAQWNMEFNIANASYYHRPLIAANMESKLPLSRLYYWSPVFTLPGTSEEVMLCSVPLIDSSGNVFGVCGFEISTMLFKLSYMPNSSFYNRMFCVFSPITEKSINLNQAMFAGGYSARIASQNHETLKILGNSSTFYSYQQDPEHSFLGIHSPIHLYPDDSAFSDEQWSVAIMIPEEDVVNTVAQLNVSLLSLLTLLIIIGILASFILSRRYLKPISEGFDIIKSADLSKAPRTKIPEIDDLIDFISSQNEELNEKANEESLSLSILDEFLENTKELSPAERAVFNLYVKGHTAKEIAEILCLSINTIKTHNKHIYVKLNVASRKELLVYVNMLKEIGKEIDLQTEI